MRIGWVAVAAALLSVPARAQLPARWPRAPQIEVARAAVHAEVAGERYGLTGRGSALCLVDTGADETRFGERARWVWEPDGSARGHDLEATFGGAVFAPGDAAGSRGDVHGHGTAMASIALGADGMAPEATLITASAWDREAEGFVDDVVVAAIRFCRAAARSDPAIDEARMVILLSLGGHDGGHDGDGAFERAIVREAGPVPVVVAAGNDGERAVHAAGRLFAGERATVTVQVPRPARADAALGLTAHLDGARARLVSPRGEAVAITPGAATLEGTSVEMSARDDAVAITLRALDGALASGTWRIELEGPGRFEVWLAGARLGSTFFAPSLGGDHVVREEVITIPATAPALIAVGATITRGEVSGGEDLGAPGEVAAFSSRGPAPSGALEPDLVAPGGWIVTALSTDARPEDPANLIGGRAALVTDGRVAVRGSSASAAMVAGALLLALELDPSIGPRAGGLLASSPAEPGWTAARGFGALDVGRLLARVGGAPVGHAELVTGRDAIEPGEAIEVAVRADGARVELRWGADRRLERPLGDGVAWARLEPPPGSDPVVIEALVDGVPFATRTVDRVPDRRRPTRLAGGCATRTPGRGTPIGTWIGLVIALARLRSGRGTRGA